MSPPPGVGALPGSVAGVVLVGGASRRMGVDKAFLEIDGRAMADRVADALIDAGCADVFAYGSISSDARRSGTDRLSVEIRPDRFPGEGPLAGVLGALAECDHDVVVVMPCDLPFLDAATVRSLVDALRGRVSDRDGRPPSDRRPQVAVAVTDRRHHACAAWERSVEPTVAEFVRNGERALHRAIDGLRSVEVVVDPRAVENVNRPDDLRRLGLHDPTGGSR